MFMYIPKIIFHFIAVFFVIVTCDVFIEYAAFNKK